MKKKKEKKTNTNTNSSYLYLQCESTVHRDPVILVVNKYTTNAPLALANPSLRIDLMKTPPLLLETNSTPSDGSVPENQ